MRIGAAPPKGRIDRTLSTQEFRLLPNDLTQGTKCRLIGAHHIFGIIGSILGLPEQADRLTQNRIWK